MKTKRPYIYIDGRGNTDFSFNTILAGKIGLHASLIVSVLLSRRAYIGPNGRKWVKVSGWDWEDALLCLNSQEIKKAIQRSVATGYVLIAENDRAVLDDQKLVVDSTVKHNEEDDFFGETEAEYLLNPIHISFNLARDGFVYLYQMPGKCKLGKTTDLNLRLKQLTHEYPPGPLLWIFIKAKDRHVLERAFHILFALQKIKGELFDLSSEDIAYFAYRASPPFVLPSETDAYLKKLEAPFSVEMANYEGRFSEAKELARPKTARA